VLGSSAVESVDLGCDLLLEDQEVHRQPEKNYGGHITDDLARFILGRVEQTYETPAALEVKFSEEHSNHYVFKFAESIVSQALFVDRGERDHTEFLHESFETLVEAVKHAAHATQILADEYILPAFGR
jgi:hypothetical protein